MWKWYVDSLWMGLLIASLILAPVAAYAQPPTAPPPAAAADEDAEYIPNAQSLEKVAELERFLQAAQDPDWLMTIGGIMLAFFGAQSFIRTLIAEIPEHAIPSAIRLAKINPVQKEGQQVMEQLRNLTVEMAQAGLRTKTAAEALQQHLRKVPGRLPYRRRIVGAERPALEALLSDPEVRQTISQNRLGRHWLQEYDRLHREYTTEMGALIRRYNEGLQRLTEFSDHANRLATGLFMADGANHPRILFEAEEVKNKPHGTIHVRMDAPFFKEITEPATMGGEIHAPLRRCDQVMSQLNLERNRAKTAIRKYAQLRPLSELGMVGIGWGLYQWGSARIRASHNADPEDIVQRAKQREQLAAAQQAFKSQELTSLIENIGKARRNDGPMKEEWTQVYEVFRRTVRDNLRAMAKDVERYTDWETRRSAGFEHALGRFMTDNEFADSVLDSALAEAASSELKASDASSVIAVLIPSSETPHPLRERLLMKHYAFVAKYLWPRLSIEGNSQPIQASTVADIVKATLPQIDGVHESHRKKKAGPAPTKPAEKPAAPEPRNDGQQSSARPERRDGETSVETARATAEPSPPATPPVTPNGPAVALTNPAP